MGRRALRRGGTKVAEGGSALDPAVVSHMLGRRRADEPLEELTPREHDVLGLMAEGRSNQAMADALVISGRAVEKHVASIFTKLHLPPAPEDHRRVLAYWPSYAASPSSTQLTPIVPPSATRPICQGASSSTFGWPTKPAFRVRIPSR
jgi:DNA-binding CsgD family transcriptional regulator